MWGSGRLFAMFDGGKWDIKIVMINLGKITNLVTLAINHSILTTTIIFSNQAVSHLESGNYHAWFMSVQFQ